MSGNTTVGADGSTTDVTTSSSFDDTMDKLFEQQEATTEALATTWDPTWYNVADQAINAINLVHDNVGLSYGASIIGVTCMIRVLMFPVFVKTQQNSSRMAHMQPEMQALRTKLDALGKNVDKETQARYGLQMKALFEKYQCNPFQAMILPFMQMPVFMGMFFGLRKMPEFFPDELASGGILWFPDLTAADPYYILPVGSALTFLISIEVGKQQMTASNPQQGQIMINVMRVLALGMVPVISDFSAGLNSYWLTNNFITMMQAMAFKNKTIRRALNIWDPPKPVPGIEQPKGIMETLQGVVQKKETEAEKIAAHNEAIENKKKLSGRSPSRSRNRRRW